MSSNVTYFIKHYKNHGNTVTHKENGNSPKPRHSEKCILRQFHDFTTIKHNYTNLDGMVYHTHRLHGRVYSNHHKGSIHF